MAPFLLSVLLQARAITAMRIVRPLFGLPYSGDSSSSRCYRGSILITSFGCI